jgi:cell wall assembly regulator SMI1
MISFYEMGIPGDEQLLAQVEMRLGKTLPKEYRSFLLRCNGATPDTNRFYSEHIYGGFGEVAHFCSVGSTKFGDALETRSLIGQYLPPEYFPIAREGGGNKICLNLDHGDFGSVYYLDSAGQEAPIRIADNFDAFIEMLEPYDEESEYELSPEP